MSHEVVFLPHILGQTWGQALGAARTAAREEDPRIVAARLEPWPDLVLHAAQILGQIEEFRGRGQRELVHPVTRLRFTFFGEDGVIALPYWYDGPVARMAATMAFRFAHAVESDTGLAAYDPQQRMPLAEMGLEKFVAGYLRGRERALEQTQARGPVPVGHALPTGRSSTRRELPAGPSAAGSRGGDAGARPVADSGRPTDPRRLRPAGAPGRTDDAVGRGPRPKNADARPGGGSRAGSGADAVGPTDARRLRPTGTPGRGPAPGPRQGGQGADQRQAANPGRLRRDGKPARDDVPGAATPSARREGAERRREGADARQAADSGPIAGSGWFRRGGKPARGEQARGEQARGEQAQRSGKAAEPRKAPRRGEPSDPDQAQRSGRVAEPRKAPRREPSDADRMQRPRDAADPRKAPRRGEREAEQAQRSGRAAEPRKVSRRERAEAEQAQRSRNPQRGTAPPGSEWVPRPGRPEPRGGVPADPGRAPRSGQPPQGGRASQRDEPWGTGEPPEPWRPPQREEPPEAPDF